MECLGQHAPVWSTDNLRRYRIYPNRLSLITTSSFIHAHRTYISHFYIECSTTKEHEPIVALSDFLLGAIASAMQQNAAAVNAFQSCNYRREKINDNFMHITVLAHIELAQILLHCDKKVNVCMFVMTNMNLNKCGRLRLIQYCFNCRATNRMPSNCSQSHTTNEIMTSRTVLLLKLGAIWRVYTEQFVYFECNNNHGTP